MRRRHLAITALATGVLLAGAWLWRTYGLQVWLEQAVAYCM
jgi:hypothetical protein